MDNKYLLLLMHGVTLKNVEQSVNGRVRCVISLIMRAVNNWDKSRKVIWAVRGVRMDGNKYI